MVRAVIEKKKKEKKMKPKRIISFLLESYNSGRLIEPSNTIILPLFVVSPVSPGGKAGLERFALR